MELAPFARAGTGAHPSIDREALLRFYADLPLDIWNISSASDLVSWEIMRNRYAITAPDAIPCDLFVWGTGEPPDQRLTRVGGVPWLPRKTAWPVIRDVVTTFFCQFDFRDSRDLMGQRASGHLPGDLLLVFVADEYSAFCADEQEICFVWVSADETDIITSADVPEPTYPFELITAWGARYRTMDVPSKWDQAYDIPDTAASGRCWILPVLWGTKIGGVPYNSQHNHDETPPGYLCQLTSIQASHWQWPWIDKENPDRAGSDELMIGDMGELTLFLRDDGTVTVDGACG